MAASHSSKTESEKLQGLSTNLYLRERLQPAPEDQLYLHLSDLLLGVKQFLPKPVPQQVLDFGCGGSPYQSLFGSTNYVRADIDGVPDIDHTIVSDDQKCRIDLPDNSFEMIFSSQVLEHVPKPLAYLREAYRLLSPGGRMLLTTHGIFEDHGCPYDFRRWTSYGLSQELQTAGFEIRRMAKLTTGPRAALFLMQRTNPRSPRSGRLGWWLYAWKKMSQKSGGGISRGCDRFFSENRVVTDSLADHPLYLGLMFEVTKP